MTARAGLPRIPFIVRSSVINMNNETRTASTFNILANILRFERSPLDSTVNSPYRKTNNLSGLDGSQPEIFNFYRIIFNFWLAIFLPRGDLLFFMTKKTKRNQVRKMVSFRIIREQSIRFFMMNIKMPTKFGLCHSAFLASIVIPLARCVLAYTPIGAVVLYVSSPPLVIILSTILYGSVLVRTLHGTALSVSYAWIVSNLFSAHKTWSNFFRIFIVWIFSANLLCFEKNRLTILRTGNTPFKVARLYKKLFSTSRTYFWEMI